VEDFGKIQDLIDTVSNTVILNKRMGKKKGKIFGIGSGKVLTVLGIIVATGGTFGGYHVYKGETFVDATPQYMSEVIDGDTFKLEGGEVVRLADIDAPEISKCYGQESKQALHKILLGQKLQLVKDVEEKDNYGRLVRIVKVINDGSDNMIVNKYLVENGFAEYKSSENIILERDLIKGESSAQSENLGLWKDCPKENPTTKTWQRLEQSSQPTNPDCLIKGNISNIGLGKIYILPHCANYKNTKIDLSKGEKYFCTSSEAETEGFKKAEGCR
jgi:micrococcal nuclease